MDAKKTEMAYFEKSNKLSSYPCDDNNNNNMLMLFLFTVKPVYNDHSLAQESQTQFDLRAIFQRKYALQASVLWKKQTRAACY
jgi:hypothetical protein